MSDDLDPFELSKVPAHSWLLFFHYGEYDEYAVRFMHWPDRAGVDAYLASLDPASQDKSWAILGIFQIKGPVLVPEPTRVVTRLALPEAQP